MKKHHKQPLLSPEKYIRTRARTLPVGSCYINDNWRESGYATILVTRIHINGNVTHGAYMVDLYCLGVKDSFWKFNEHPKDFHELLDKQQRENDSGIRMRKVDYQLVHNIIYGAIAFAEELGFHPHKTFDLPKYILEEDTDNIKLIDIEFGYKGKPLYISSPENPGEKIRVLPHLEKKLGQGNYYFITEAEAEEFFEREEEDESDEMDYHNPEVKKNLILDFVSLASSPKKFLKRNLEKIGELMEKADIIFFVYMVTVDEQKKASAAIGELFDFSITSEVLSDSLLFGKMEPPANSKEIAKQAERLYHMATSEQWKEGLTEVDKMRIQYPEIPVFQYLYLKFMELKTGLRNLLPQLEILTNQNPAYLPFAYMYASAFILNNPNKTSYGISEELYLKNFYPGRSSFCREEFLLFIHLLILNYGLSGEMLMVEEMLLLMGRRYPGLMHDELLFEAKIGKIPFVVAWCENWIKENP
ncbi:MAG: hypothetical protein IH596_05050 [Bacteroidales bacterium]|nr:hypothetical protein [Bacteroidales bacterium]